MPKGEKNKLTVFERLEIFNLKARLHQEWEDGLKVSTKNIASKYGISQAAVYKIWNNENGQLDYIIALEKLVQHFSSTMDLVPQDLKDTFMAGLTGKEREIIGRLVA